MIVVTRLNGSQFAVNPDLIERIHASPDTTLIMVDGAKYVVTETMADVIAQITAFRARVLAAATAYPESPARPATLGLVPPLDEPAVEGGE
ncbi:flagellar protein FlbD [Paramicrobacterium humi]|uniref:Flagellar protein FlbD n=1 Tax=Paramicrobacterium humi TaxID=640635 RepID=A0A1H4N5G0_9MICO|nr:flagellar FlbD family protein [Microbacterium humi]SEB89842.1 flagellar protein FlbD [Microbacterium humi]